VGVAGMLGRVARAWRVAVLGGSGLVGSQVRALAQPAGGAWPADAAGGLWPREVEVIVPRHAELDVLDEAAVASFLDASRPDALLNLVAWADVDGAEAERGDTAGQVYRLNAHVPGVLARLCSQRGVFFVHVSTDYVFDGTNDTRPYREQDPANPLCWYARTKYAGELAIGESGAAACIARIEMPFTAQEHAKRDFARTCLARLRAGQPLAGVTDQRITPVLLDDAARALLRLAALRRPGIVHVAATSWTTPYLFARGIAERLRLDTGLVEPARFDEFSKRRPATRPQHSWLDVSLCSELIGPGIPRPMADQLDAWAAQLLVVDGRGTRSAN